MNRLRLHIPNENELEYRCNLISDEETMSYNKGYGDNGSGSYHITIEQARDWHKNWNNSNGNYYAYIVRTDDGVQVGEVDIHWSEPCQKHIIGVVIEAKYRGCGYSEEALHLLADVAFNELNLDRIYDDFPVNRVAAEKSFAKVGFVRINDKYVELKKECVK
ncbi:MAG: GNAT family N-acetyltransferase [Saccharofermentanales bacterium]